MSTIIKIIIAIVAIIIISTFIAPLLATVVAPFGTILLILLYLAVVAWLLNGWLFPPFA